MQFRVRLVCKVLYQFHSLLMCTMSTHLTRLINNTTTTIHYQELFNITNRRNVPCSANPIWLKKWLVKLMYKLVTLMYTLSNWNFGDGYKSVQRENGWINGLLKSGDHRLCVQTRPLSRHSSTKSRSFHSRRPHDVRRHADVCQCRSNPVFYIGRTLCKLSGKWAVLAFGSSSAQFFVSSILRPLCPPSAPSFACSFVPSSWFIWSTLRSRAFI